MRKDVCGVLRDRIVKVSYKPGEPLNEANLAKEFGVSKTPVREALIRLSEESLVVIIPHAGARVADINLIETRNLIEVRLVLERGVARLAAENVTEEQIHDLSRLHHKINQLNDNDVFELINCDVEFHQVISQAANNQLLDKFLLIVRNQFHRIQNFFPVLPDGTQTDIPKVIHALKQRDADEMERVMVNHVEHFVAKLRNAF